MTIKELEDILQAKIVVESDNLDFNIDTIRELVKEAFHEDKT